MSLARSTPGLYTSVHDSARSSQCGFMDSIKRIFLVSTAPLNFLFAGDCRVGINKTLVIEQPRKVISAGESRNQFVLVLKNPAGQLSSDARVQHMRSRPIRHDVNMKSFRLSHTNSTNASSENSVGTSRCHPSFTNCVIPKLGALQPSEGSRADHNGPL